MIDTESERSSAAPSALPANREAWVLRTAVRKIDRKLSVWMTASMASVYAGRKLIACRFPLRASCVVSRSASSWRTAGELRRSTVRWLNRSLSYSVAWAQPATRATERLIPATARSRALSRRGAPGQGIARLSRQTSRATAHQAQIGPRMSRESRRRRAGAFDVRSPSSTDPAMGPMGARPAARAPSSNGSAPLNGRHHHHRGEHGDGDQGGHAGRRAFPRRRRPGADQVGTGVVDGGTDQEEQGRGHAHVPQQHRRRHRHADRHTDQQGEPDVAQRCLGLEEHSGRRG